jgi:hypothetical protein
MRCVSSDNNYLPLRCRPARLTLSPSYPMPIKILLSGGPFPTAFWDTGRLTASAAQLSTPGPADGGVNLTRRRNLNRRGLRLNSLDDSGSASTLSSWPDWSLELRPIHRLVHVTSESGWLGAWGKSANCASDSARADWVTVQVRLELVRRRTQARMSLAMGVSAWPTRPPPLNLQEYRVSGPPSPTWSQYMYVYVCICMYTYVYVCICMYYREMRL